MRLLNLFDHFIEDFSWMAAATVIILGFWLFGKRLAMLKIIVENHPVKSALIDLIAAPLMILLLGNFAQSIFTSYSAVDVSDQIFDLVLLVLLLSTAWCLARLIELFFVSNRESDGVAYLPGLQRGLLFSGFLFIGVALFIYLQGYSITGLYISTGAVAALLAFAMQQTLGDLFSGIALSIEHPFKLGERIRLADGSEGKVIDINWRATRLLAWDNSTLVVPNSELAKQGFTNLHGFGVESGWGRNRIISFFDHDFGHLYSPVSRICAHPRGEICDRSSCGLSRPARFRAATARPRWSVFQ